MQYTNCIRLELGEMRLDGWDEGYMLHLASFHPQDYLDLVIQDKDKVYNPIIHPTVI